MDQALLIAVVGAISGLVGTALGGLISYSASRANHSAETQAAIRRRSYEERELLFSDFLAAAMQVYLLGLSRKGQTQEPEFFHRLVTLEARIWLHSKSVADNARALAMFVMKEAEGSSGAETAVSESNGFPALRDAYLESCASELERLRGAL